MGRSHDEPAAGAPAEGRRPRDVSADPAPMRGSDVERPIVLLVDDEQALRALGRRILERNGFDVLEASTGADAVQVAHDAGHIQLLVTDLSMPGMSGHELAERLTQEHDGLGVLFVSGCDVHELERVVEARPASAYLEKPFSPSSLVVKLRELLGEG